MANNITPDIEVLIGALGGTSPSGESAGLIRAQLNEALGKSVVEIKVAAKTSEAVKEISELSKRINSIKDSKTLSNAFSEPLKNISQRLKEVNDALTPITKALTTEGSAFNQMGKEGSASLDSLVNKLNEVKNIIDLLSKKSLGMRFNISTGNGISASLQNYKDSASQYANKIRELYSEVRTQFNATYSNGVLPIYAKQAGMSSQDVRQLATFASMSNKEISNMISKMESFKTPVGIEASLATFKEMYDLATKFLKSIDDLNEKSKGSDYSRRYNGAYGLQLPTFVEDVEAEKAKVESQASEVKNSISSLFGASSGSQQISGELISQISTDLSEIRKQLESVFSLEDVDPKYEKIKEITDTIYNYFKEVSDKVKTDFAGVGTAIANEIKDANKKSAKASSKKSPPQKGYTKKLEKANNIITEAKRLQAENKLDLTKDEDRADNKKAYYSAVDNFVSKNESFVKSLSGDKKASKEELETLEKILAEWGKILQAKKDYDKSEGSSKNYESFLTKIEKERNKLKKAGYIGKEDEDFYKKLDDLEEKARKGAPIKELQKDFSALQGEILKSKANVETFGHALQRAFSEKFKYLIASMGFMYLRRAISDLVANVKDLDSAMTQIKIVTGESSESLKKFSEQAAHTADEVGASITDVIKSTETYARLGYNLEDSLKLSEITAKYSNVAATDTESATAALTSIMKAFNYKPEQMENVVDMLVKVGQEYAISAGELGDALQRGGAALAVGGATLEESIAIMTAGNAAVQNADTVGNALKTVSARIRSSTAELEEMGEEVDSLVSSSSKYREEILALSGVDIMSDAATYKSVYQILSEVAEVYDSLDDTSKARLLEDLGGKRNATVIGSIISNLDDLKGAYDAAKNSAGTLEEANSIYLDSIQGKMNQLRASWQALSEALLDSRLVKYAVDAGRLILGVFNAIDDATNGLSTDALSIYVIVVAMQALVKTLKGMEIIKNIATLLSGSFTKIGEILAALKAGILSFGSAGALLSAAAPYLVAVAAAAGLIVATVKEYNKNHPNTKQLKEDLADLENELSDLKNKAETVKERIDELNKKKENGTLLQQEKEELNNLTAENEALTTQIALYEDLAKKKQAAIEAQKSKEAKEYFSPSEPKYGNSKKGSGTKSQSSKSTRSHSHSRKTTTIDDRDSSYAEGADPGLNKGKTKVESQIILYKNLTSAMAKAKTAEEEHAIAQQRNSVQQWLADEMTVIKEFVNDPTYGEEARDLIDLISSIILGGIDDVANNAENKINDIDYQIVPKTVDEIKNQVAAMEDAVDEYAKYGGLTKDTIDDLKTNIPGLVAALYDQNGELTEAGKAALKSDSALRVFAEDAIKAAKTINGMSLSEAKQKLKELETAAYSAAYSFTVAGKTMTVALDPQEKRARMEQIDALKKEIAQAENEIANTVNGWSKYNPDAGKSGSKKDTFKEGLENELKKLKHLLEMEKITYEQYYSGVAEIRNRYIANAYRDEDGYREEILDLEEEIFNGRLTILQDFVNDYDHIIEKLTANGQILQAKDDYEKVLKRIEQEMQWAINNGLDKNGDFMQELEKQWKTTAKNIVDMIQGVYDEFESYADDFEMWDKLPFSKDDFYDSDISKIKNYYAAGLLGEAEYVRMSNEIQKKRFDYHNDSLNEIIDLTIKMIEKESDDIVDAIDEEIDAYDKLIERKKKLLQDTADEADHEEEIADAVKEIAKLQSKISQLSLDDSRQAAAKKAELEEQLAEKQKELDKSQRDYALNQTMEALDESQDAFEKEKEAEKKAAEKSIETWMQKYEKAIDMLENDTEGTYKKLLEYADKYSTSIDGPNSIRTAWEAVLDVMKECGTFQNAASFIRDGENYGINPDIDGTISRDIIGEKYGVWIANKNNTSPAGVKTGDLVITGGGIYKRNQPGQESPLVETLTDYIGKPTTQNYADVEKAYAEYLRKHGLVYHNGGVVGRGTSQDNETVALLQKGEIVLDSKKKQALQDMLTQVGQMATYAAAVKASGRANTSYSTVGDTFAPHVEININHSGTLTANDAKHYGSVAADAALEKLRTAFNRRGL